MGAQQTMYLQRQNYHLKTKPLRGGVKLFSDYIFALDAAILKTHNILSSFEASVVVDFLFIVIPIVGFCNCSMFCMSILVLQSS